MLEFILGRKTRMLVPVRNVAEILASHEQIYRKNAHLMDAPGEPSAAQTTRGRVEGWAANNGEAGIAYNRLRDAFQRGYGDRLFLVDFNTLTREPGPTMKKIWDFLEMDAPAHDFDHIQQLTLEDDTIYGYRGLHEIRPKVEPVADKALQILGPEMAARYANLDFWKRTP